MNKITIYDTTLRDGAQNEGISFSVEDKLRIAQRLDQLGIHYIEGGWPGANPKDIQFFKRISKSSLSFSKIAAFGSTRHRSNTADSDPNLQALLKTDISVITIFGKSWDLHVKEILGISLQENLDLIYDSLSFIRHRVDEVIYDAEHFFDGYKANPEYAIKTLKAAESAGVHCLVLCDTNGGTLPDEIEQIIVQVKNHVDTPLGIHAHNDSGVAVASSLIAIKHGVYHIHGTINGYGERCGNANLCTLLPNIKLKLKLDCISDDQIKELSDVSWFVSELANLKHQSHQPYVGESAFAHKGGVHVSAVMRNARSYEHIEPDLVGNKRKILVSDQSGRGAITYKAKEYGLDLTKDTPEVHSLLADVKQRELEGFQFEGAEASFELMIKKALGLHKKLFELIAFRVIVERREHDEEALAEATIKIRTPLGMEQTAADGNGPVDALNKALRKALEKFYPSLQEVELIDYKVRIINEHEGTGAKTRVLIESGDEENSWNTVGVSANIIEASWQALVDSIEYKLLKEELQIKSDQSGD
jgi:2-isopropylmalate synthase